MESPDFTVPENPPHLQKRLSSLASALLSAIRHIIDQENMEELCIDAELLFYGKLTRLEWLQFFIWHTQRHIHQVQNIYDLVIR